MPGNGKYFIKVDPVTDVVRVWLYNFDKNQAKLKPAHVELLNRAVAPVIRDGGAIKLLGLASTTGNPVWDHNLGVARTHSVANYLHTIPGARFNISKEVSAGKNMALAFNDAKMQGGTADNVESEVWRAVVINAWGRSLPPPPAGLDVPFGSSTWADKLGKAIDIGNIGLGLVDLVADLGEVSNLAEVTGPAGLVVGSVGTLVSMPLTWISADALANTNGQIQGAADAIQDMADQYSNASLDRIGLSQWPRLTVPELHLPDNPQPNAGQQAWRAGQAAGRNNVVNGLLSLERNPKPITLPDGRHIRINGRVWLRSIYRAYGDDAGVKVVVIPANEELRKRGRAPFPTH